MSVRLCFECFLLCSISNISNRRYVHIRENVRIPNSETLCAESLQKPFESQPLRVPLSSWCIAIIAIFIFCYQSRARVETVPRRSSNCCDVTFDSQQYFSGHSVFWVSSDNFWKTKLCWLCRKCGDMPVFLASFHIDALVLSVRFFSQPVSCIRRDPGHVRADHVPFSVCRDNRNIHLLWRALVVERFQATPVLFRGTRRKLAHAALVFLLLSPYDVTNKQCLFCTTKFFHRPPSPACLSVSCVYGLSCTTAIFVHARSCSANCNSSHLFLFITGLCSCFHARVWLGWVRFFAFRLRLRFETHSSHFFVFFHLGRGIPVHRPPKTIFPFRVGAASDHPSGWSGFAPEEGSFLYLPFLEKQGVVLAKKEYIDS